MYDHVSSLIFQADTIPDKIQGHHSLLPRFIGASGKYSPQHFRVGKIFPFLLSCFTEFFIQQVKQFQRYLIYNHAAGIGEPGPEGWIWSPQPGLADLAWPNTIATAIAAIVFAIGANARFAWETFSDRMQRDIALVLRVLAYLSLATAWVLSVPLLVYRLLMLLWSLWLAFALLRWLKWGWQAYSTHGLWRTVSFKRRNKDKGVDSSELDAVNDISDGG